MLFGNHPLKQSGAVTLDLFNELKKRGHNVRLMVNVYDKGYPEGVISMDTLFSSYKERVINKLKRIFKLDQKRPTDKKYHFYGVDEKKMFYSNQNTTFHTIACFARPTALSVQDYLTNVS